LERSNWQSLDGPWDFALDSDARWSSPEQLPWNGTIQVPCAAETPAGGIGDTSFYLACWYRRTFDAPPLTDGQRLLLHSGAVDTTADVRVNGRPAAGHEGGYTPFRVDVRPLLVFSESQTIVVRAHDDPHDLAKPRGKQNWLLESHSIWYPRTTGIWQTVWLERVPAT
jgi:beta-galactosidase/beta-glucuronidase